MKYPLILTMLAAVIFSGCQPEVEDNTPPAQPPSQEDLPKKIVIVEDGDSIVHKFVWADGKMQRSDVSYYESGAVVRVESETHAYHSDGLILFSLFRGKDLVANDPYRSDFFYYHQNGKVVGARMADSAGAWQLYSRYEYNTRSTPFRIADDMDSVSYFTGGEPGNYSYDSLIYDNDGKLIQMDGKYRNRANGMIEPDFTIKYKNFANGKSYLPAGMNHYLIYWEGQLLTGNNPGIEEHTWHGTPTGDQTTVNTWTTTFDTDGRVSKRTYLLGSNNNAQGDWFFYY